VIENFSIVGVFTNKPPAPAPLLSKTTPLTNYDSVADLVANNLGAPLLLSGRFFSSFYNLVVLEDFIDRQRPSDDSCQVYAIDCSIHGEGNRLCLNLKAMDLVAVLEYTPEAGTDPARQPPKEVSKASNEKWM